MLWQEAPRKDTAFVGRTKARFDVMTQNPEQKKQVHTKRVALGMSGGVDSAVSATFLQRAGYEVLGVTCLFQDDKASLCAAEEAAVLCAQRGIEHSIYDSTSEFRSCVIEPFIADYEAGLTPSPCVKCNAQCKIPQLMKAADELDCDFVATGHYARIAQISANSRYAIKTALDLSKDQSYMLAYLNQKQLSRLVLPLGAITKAEVRIIAEDLGLPNAHKPESQDICFIEGSHVDFLINEGAQCEKGSIVNRAGDHLGIHDGLIRYTVGQRKGIGIAAPKPYYVIEKRSVTNELVIGFQEEAMISEAYVEDINWQAIEDLDDSLECMVKLRYRSERAACVLEALEEGGYRIMLQSPQPTTAAGQYAVFYQGETLLGGGTIVSVG